MLCRKKKKKIPPAAEVPGSMILGGVEVLVGSLVWVLPFPGTKQVGGIIIGDGLRRTFNGLEELDQENQKKKQNSAQKNFQDIQNEFHHFQHLSKKSDFKAV